MMMLRRLAMLLGACAVVAGCNERSSAPEPVRPVLSIKVEPHAAGGIAVVGTVAPRYTSELAFRVLGRVIARPVHVGDMVTQGQMVAAVDPQALELAVRAATASVASSEAQLTNATGIESRQRTLLETDATTHVNVENAEQGRAAAVAAVTQARANLAKAREQLGYAQLKADFAGVVTAVNAEVGQVVSPGQAVVTVARPDVREAVIDVGEDVVGTLRPGTPFTVRLQIDPTVTASGKVREIAPRADTATRTYRVRITLDDPPEALRLGSTVTTRLVAADSSAIRLPASARLDRDGKTYVWLVDADSKTVHLREVTAARNADGSMRISAGLDFGVRVVTAGVHSLKEGQAIRLDQEARE